MELKKSIEDFLNEYNCIIEKKWLFQGAEVSIRDFCEEGYLSILKSVHGLDVDKNSETFCFRAERDDRNDSYNKLRKANNLKMCMDEMMFGTRDAINNKKDSEYFKSFSKMLAAPLFKYYNSNRLVISELKINTIEFQMMVNCFDWNGEGDTSWDNNGNEHDRYHAEIFEVCVPIKEITSAKRMHSYMWDFLDGNLEVSYVKDTLEDGSVCRDYLMSIYSVDIEMIGFTIDTSCLYREKFDNYLNSADPNGSKLKRFASYKKDLEVISTDSGYIKWDINNPDLIQLIRFLYLLRISNYPGDFKFMIEKIITEEDNKFIVMNDLEKKAFNWISEYLSGDILQYEKEKYDKLFEYSNEKFPIQHLRLWAGIDGLKDLLNNEAFQKICFKNQDLFFRMRKLANI
ncbi:hypothetical protein [Lacrimispora amygdalina]|uniref:hypothetical protein n=1 Tax=Lacrimispora amygdalina TaxID=253257 RepID=UPI000BE23DBF|nr:hypothetical protein [Lacrimispora amygdalina]